MRTSTPVPSIVGYGEGLLYPPSPENFISSIQHAEWTAINFSLFHIDTAGSIIFNNVKIVHRGAYIGAAGWPAQFVALKKDGGSKVNTISATIGGWQTGDFVNIAKIYAAHNDSFAGTELQKNFQTLRKNFPTIAAIDMDCEDFGLISQSELQAGLVAFCKMLIELGFDITFCPFNSHTFWIESLAALEQHRSGAVKHWNLQCYSGGGSNTPEEWSAYIKQAMPSFDTEGFIIVGLAGGLEGSDPAQIEAQLTDLCVENGVVHPSVGGAFIWTLDHIWFESDRRRDAMVPYVQAMREGLLLPTHAMSG